MRRRWLGWLALALLLHPVGAQSGNRLVGRDEWVSRLDVFRGQSQQMLLDTRFRQAAARQGPFARHNRIAQDYAYAIHEHPHDERLLRRLLSDNLMPVETYTAADGTCGAVFRDLKTGSHIIAFRGTLAEEDWWRNYSEASAAQAVGTLSYARHHEVFDRWAETYGRSGPLEVTGHSRGGGLAQLFTSFHGDRVARTVTFQSVGTDEKARERYERIPTDRRGENYLFVSTHDPVSDVGGDHLGEPTVFLFTGKDLDKADRKLGHSSFACQPEGLTDWTGAPYRDPEDGRVLVTVPYWEYRTQMRGGAIMEALQKAGVVAEAGGTAATVSAGTVAGFVQREGSRPEESRWRKDYPSEPASKRDVEPPPMGRLVVSVVDAQTGEPLRGTVTCEGRAVEVAGGPVTLSLPPDHELKLLVAAPGYAPREARGRLAPGQEKQYVARMKRLASPAGATAPAPATGPFDGVYNGHYKAGSNDAGEVRFTISGARVQGSLQGSYQGRGSLSGSFSGELVESSGVTLLQATIRGTVVAPNGVQGAFEGTMASQLTLVQGSKTTRSGEFQFRGRDGFWMVGKDGVYVGRWGGNAGR